MTDKELHKLGRRELLQLMLAQGREAEQAKQELSEAQERLEQLEESYERLKRRLDDKDMQIHKLRAALQTVQGEPGSPDLAGVVSAALAVPDDYYAPPPQAETAPPEAQDLPAQAARPAQRAPRHPESGGYTPVKPDLSAAHRPVRREQEYYDYLFGPVANQQQSQPPTQRDRPRQQAQPGRTQQAHQAERVIQQWIGPQPFSRDAQRGLYDMNAAPQYKPMPAAYAYEREPPPPPSPPRGPESVYPVQSPDEFIPQPDKAPESSVQVMNAVEIVNGRPVSQNQVLRPRH